MSLCLIESGFLFFFYMYNEKYSEKFCGFKKSMYLCIAFREKRAFSSAGLEHLPYKQRVGGSNPSTPTKQKVSLPKGCEAFSFFAYDVLILAW